MKREPTSPHELHVRIGRVDIDREAVKGERVAMHLLVADLQAALAERLNTSSTELMPERQSARWSRATAEAVAAHVSTAVSQARGQTS